MIKRVILIVLDSVGIGALPDAADYGDEGANTLGHIAAHYPALSLPNLTAMGLGNIGYELSNSRSNNTLTQTNSPTASYGKAAEQSAGKDTTTGHWEISGKILDKAFPTFPNGFPQSFMAQFEEAIGTETIGNKTASGTTIINELGEEHLKNKNPIVYTSADSVFQIAMHEDVYSIERQYEICKVARAMLKDELEVGRVIARPFVGTPGNFTRTSRRKDFAVEPPNNVLTAIQDAGKTVYAVGKIVDIFADKGITDYVKTASNDEGITKTIEAMNLVDEGLIFTNLVDFDMLYGHRRDVVGYANCLMDFDKRLPDITIHLRKDDLLIITADHGNDPTAPGTDHTREYVPILNYGAMVKAGVDIGVRESFADIGATVGDLLGVAFEGDGISYAIEILA